MYSSSTSSILQYPYPSTVNVSNFVSIKLTESNYLLWKAQIFCLIESQDFLGFIDDTNTAPAETVSVPDESSSDGRRQVVNRDYLIWRRSDRLLKGWILGSLSENVLSSVVGLNTARDVWSKLESSFSDDSKILQVQPESSTTTKDESKAGQKDRSWYVPLYVAALRGDWESAKRFMKQDEAAATARITALSSTVLHVVVGTGKTVHFVEKLVKLMPTDALALRDDYGNTALNVAAVVGNTEAAVILVKKNPALLHIRNNTGFLPVHRAGLNAHRDTLLYLLTIHKDDIEPGPLADQSGVQLLVSVIDSGFFDVALDLVQHYPSMGTMKLKNGDSGLKAIARKASAFPSGSCLSFWERLIYSFVHVKVENRSQDPHGGDIENPADSSQVFEQICGLICLFEGNQFIYVPKLKPLREQKLMHHQALDLVKSLCEIIKSLNDATACTSLYEEPILVAAKLGIHEVVETIVDTFPDALYSRDEDNHYTFEVAVINRCENVFNLIYQMTEYKQYATLLTDDSGNNILHLAGRLAPIHKLNLVSGAALQMQRELQWFKRKIFTMFCPED
ncbi:unnamed protein product [Ilex paraguariensis]|uniref:Uncharacterized protein n=1 Tax=Ilex paraguariensis TaxID=185542 RepID=A0ABC8R0H7_9AQUA